MHSHTIVTYIMYKRHKSPSIGYQVMAESLRPEKILKIRQSKENNSTTITDDIQIKPNVHTITIIIYIQYTFYEMSSVGYRVTAEDGKNY